MDEWKLLHQFNQFKQSNIKKRKNGTSLQLVSSTTQKIKQLL